MMKLEHYPSEKLKQEIRAILANYLDLSIYQPFFFGSRVSGTGDARSDIDIGIEGPEPIPSTTLAEIREAVDDLPILYKIDVIDFHAASDDFREVARQHVEPIT